MSDGGRRRRKMKKDKNSRIKQNIRPYIMLHIIIMLYSLCGVCSKAALGQKFILIKFIFFYGLMIFILGIYSILWQQILKYLPLNIAYANKSVTIIWAMVWGVIIYHETISVKMVIGAAVVLFGVILIVTGDNK